MNIILSEMHICLYNVKGHFWLYIIRYKIPIPYPLWQTYLLAHDNAVAGTINEIVAMWGVAQMKGQLHKSVPDTINN